LLTLAEQVLEDSVQKFRNYYFSWNPYLKTDSVNQLILFFVKDSKHSELAWSAAEP
jgi:hypothetical protein